MPCQSCGACCAFSREWPRFSLETDEELARIPEALIDQGLGRMGSTGERCLGLAGDVGVATSCTIYDVRPHVCRVCQPGDAECNIARASYGLAAIALDAEAG